MSLVYYQRKHTDIDLEIRVEMGKNTYVEFMLTFKLVGDSNKIGTKHIYNELKLLIIDGPSWIYIKPFALNCDGRGTILAIKK